MPDPSSSEIDPSLYKLPARFDTAACDEVAKDLRELQQHAVNLDASDVEVLMSQAALLLLSAKRTWEEEGKSFQIENASPAFDRDMRTLGISIEQLVSEK